MKTIETELLGEPFEVALPRAKPPVYAGIYRPHRAFHDEFRVSYSISFEITHLTAEQREGMRVREVKENLGFTASAVGATSRLPPEVSLFFDGQWLSEACYIDELVAALNRLEARNLSRDLIFAANALQLKVQRLKTTIFSPKGLVSFESVSLRLIKVGIHRPLYSPKGI